MDNLESQTYEIFERDPIKYGQYQKVRCCFFHFIDSHLDLNRINDKLFLTVFV